ncbi:MAG: DUF1887 family CARF protein [Saprospiraceae bacterium]|nr:DUF1887 family protein [Lewinella sp.]
MIRTLISIVGDQPAPNIFLIRDQYFRTIDRHLFITTDLMIKRLRLNHLIEATGISPDKYSSVVVPADNLLGLRKKLDQLNLQNDQSLYLVNLSCGSKMMSVGIYNYFTQPGLRDQSQIFYLPIYENHFLQIFPEPQQRFPLSHRIGVMEYLKSYGISVRSASFGQTLMPLGFHQRIVDLYLSSKRPPTILQKKFWTSTNNLRIANNSNKKDYLIVEQIPQLGELLSELNFKPETKGILQTEEIHFWMGGWLEEYLYHLVKETLGLSSLDIGRNIVIDWLGPENEYGNNEFDLIFIYRNTLYIIECKAGLGKKEQVKTHFNIAVHRLAALRKELGLRVRTLFLTLSTRLRNESGDILEPYFSRVMLLDIPFFDRNDIPDNLVRFLKEL